MVHRGVLQALRQAWRLEQRRGLVGWVTAVDSRPPSIVFLGPPGVGKGSYSSRTADYFGLLNITTGHLMRDQMISGTSLGHWMEEQMVAGAHLLPDSPILRLVRDAVMRAHSEGHERFVMDGFPRTVAQAQALEQFADVQLAINLCLDTEALVQKCLGVRTCIKCHRSFNVADVKVMGEGGHEIHIPPIDPPPQCAKYVEAAPAAGTDDPSIHARLEEYRGEAAPVLQYYAESGRLVNFDITGGVQDTLPHLLDLLKPLLEARSQQTASMQRLAVAGH